MSRAQVVQNGIKGTFQILLANNNERFGTSLLLPPVIIKYPFWEAAEANNDATYACVNLGEACSPNAIAKRSILIDGDIRECMSACLSQIAPSVSIASVSLYRLGQDMPRPETLNQTCSNDDRSSCAGQTHCNEVVRHKHFATEQFARPLSDESNVSSS